jgi:hypothetical protein
MRNFTLPLATMIFCIGCTTGTQKTITNTAPEQAAKNAYITDDKGDQLDTSKANVYRILIDGNKSKIQRSVMNGKSTIATKAGENNIQIQCTYRGSYNFHWIRAKLEENQRYTAYCVGDISDALIGKKTNALYAFISTHDELASNKAHNQAIINTPPTESLSSPIAEGNTRVVLFNKKSTLFGIDNSFPYRITIHDKNKATIHPNKYIVLDIPNGKHNLKSEYSDVFTFKKETEINLQGKTLYIELSNGASSISANILDAAPADFTAIYKLNDLSKYFK